MNVKSPILAGCFHCFLPHRSLCRTDDDVALRAGQRPAQYLSEAAMCGICGSLSLDGAPVDKMIVRKMVQMLAHRGPDDEGFHSEGAVALGQRRLSIIDLAGGHQPLANEDQTIWVTYNGEIYNYRTLMADLQRRGHRFQTRSDTEVIVHAYEEFGIECLHQFNGMFAFALWDSRKQRLVLARDPFGIKPLYFWCDAHHLVFSSESKAFLADPKFVPEVDLTALDQYLTYQFVPSPHTIFKGVKKLQPGHCLVVDSGKPRVLRFTSASPTVRKVASEPEAVRELQQHLLSAVKRQMISDVPVGALLSGGVDSAAVVAIMSQNTQQKVMSFTVGFDGLFAKNELAAARRSAEILGTDHHEVVIGARECIEAFETVVWHLDEPVATPSALAMYWLSRLAAQHVKVVLTGQGADEPWAGYRRYRADRLGGWYRRLPRPLRRHLIAPIVDLLPRSDALKRATFSQGTEDPAQRFAEVYTVFTPEMKSLLYRDGLTGVADSERCVEPLRYWQSPVSHLEPLAQQLYVETRFSLPDDLLLYGDKMSMAASLEARVPLLDLELMAFVESLPAALRLKGWSGHKYLYRKAIAKWLPEEILRRPKIGFATPVDEWFQGELLDYVRDKLTSSGSACAHYFDVRYVASLIDRHHRRREDHTRALFSLLMFEQWHQLLAIAQITKKKTLPLATV